MRSQYAQWLLAGLGVLGTAFAQDKIKIMPLGDSITEITCWRALVWDQLADAGLDSKVQFVGSMTSNTQNCKAKEANWDHHHEGHSGWLAIDIANRYLTNWLATSKPDIVMFMLGTNDVNGRHTTTDIMAAYTKMVTEMRASNPKMKIIVDKVIPLPFSPAGINAINEQIPTWAAGLNSTDSPIAIADCNTGFPSSDLRDGVHPNAAGDQIIASKVGPLLIDFVKSMVAA